MEEYEEVLTTPSGICLNDGTVVMLARFPGTKWVVRNGWYTYNDKQYFGWYFVSIPANTVIPVNEEDLTLLTVISDDRCWGCVPNPYKHPVPPMVPDPSCPDTQKQHPDKTPLLYREMAELRHELDRTFITVPSILDRDRLRYSCRLLDGKLVRVNHVVDENSTDIGPKYYRYDKITETFYEVFLENEVSGEQFTELEENVAELDEIATQGLEWQYL